MPISEEMPSNDATNKPGISRRRAIRLGVQAAAGATVGLAASATWVKPAIASVKLKEGCSGSPPPGRPSIEVSKDAHVVKRFQRELIVSGTITIRNASEVQVVVEKLDDTLQYREGNKWKDAPTTIQSLSGCGPGSCIKVHKTGSGDYTVDALVPLSADTFRNRVDVKVMYRDKIFSYTADVEQDLVQVPPEQPPPTEVPTDLPSEQPSP
jgi:hypothetical protein